MRSAALIRCELCPSVPCRAAHPRATLLAHLVSSRLLSRSFAHRHREWQRGALAFCSIARSRIINKNAFVCVSYCPTRPPLSPEYEFSCLPYITPAGAGGRCLQATTLSLSLSLTHTHTLHKHTHSYSSCCRTHSSCLSHSPDLFNRCVSASARRSCCVHLNENESDSE